MSLFLIKRIVLGLVIGGVVGFIYQKLVGCRTGACPLTATPLRGITYGAVMGLLFALSGCSRSERPQTPNTPSTTQPTQESTVSSASNVIHLTTSAFEKVKNQDKVVLIDFWAPWCGPCRVQGPILDQVSSRIGDKAIVAKVNVDEEPNLASPFGIQAIPTLIIMKGGKVVQRFTGVQQADALVMALEAAGA